MEEPPADVAELVPYDTELPKTMQMIIGDNPALKMPGLDRLVSYTETCDPMPLRQVYGVLKQAIEAPRLTKLQSVKFQWILLRYFAKHEVVQTWPAVWPIVEWSFEDVMIRKWQSMSGTAPRKVFIVKFQPELGMFLEPSSLEAAVEAEKNETKLAPTLLVRLLAKRIGQQLWAGESRTAKWTVFVENMQKRLDSLIHLDFEADERRNYFKIALQEADVLLAAGFPLYGKYEVHYKYFTKDKMSKIDSLKDVFHFLYQIALRQLAINCGAVSLYKWEQHLLQALGGQIPGFPSTIRLEATLVGEVTASRQVGIPAVQPCLTYEAMKTALGRVKTDLHELDRWSYLDVDFFFDDVPQLAVD